ncbi:hypothetical protein NDU88_000499 [Pleurodeles waltl]|uniref:Uncharacterized protein n=1 Tax=Pleurodeles waltl TaxID=8319 RepID=A0AAV7KN00_PLEWA|nr:hypothetical protein NDU88_000499 [Pleurodeles waltl]
MSTGTRTALSPSTGAAEHSTTTGSSCAAREPQQHCHQAQETAEHSTTTGSSCAAREPQQHCHQAQDTAEHSTTTGSSCAARLTSTGIRAALSPRTGASRTQHDYWKQLCNTTNEHRNQNCTVTKHRSSRTQHDYWKQQCNTTNEHGNQNCSVTEHRSEQNTARLLEPAREPEL